MEITTTLIVLAVAVLAVIGGAALHYGGLVKASRGLAKAGARKDIIRAAIAVSIVALLLALMAVNKRAVAAEYGIFSEVSTSIVYGVDKGQQAFCENGQGHSDIKIELDVFSIEFESYEISFLTGLDHNSCAFYKDRNSRDGIYMGLEFTLEL